MKKIKFPEEFRGGRIGKGWYEDYSDHIPDGRKDVKEIAADLLRGKLSEIFEIAGKNKEKSYAS